MNPINELGIYQKCEIKREALERYGSKTTIRQCHVCRKHTDTYQSRAGGDIVCGKECNDVMSIMHRVHKDKSGRPFEQVVEEKTKIMVASYENEEAEEDWEDTQRLTLVINKYLNKEFKEEYLYPKEEAANILNEQLPMELVEVIFNNVRENVELRNTEPIITNISNIEWSESSVITQPWEINREFEWKEEDLYMEIESFEESAKVQESQSEEVKAMRNQIKEIEEIIKRQEVYTCELGNKYLQICKGNEENKRLIKERETFIERLIESSDYLIRGNEIEKENLKRDLEAEKLVNDFINQYMYPVIETTSMENFEF